MEKAEGFDHDHANAVAIRMAIINQKSLGGTAFLGQKY
jgi:hypothetical protein